ncbi:MAG: aspartate racemase, partial [Pseudomonadota bacterium]
QGAEAVVLGCTEIPLLVEPHHTDIRLYNTTVLHAQAAVTAALNKS